MPNVSKGIGQPKKGTNTLRRISLLTFPILIYLVKSTSSNLLSTRTRPVKNLRTIKKMLCAIVGKDKVALMTLLQYMSIPSKEKRKIIPISSILTIKKRVITLTSILKI